MIDVGNILKQEREKQGHTIKSIAQTTKISASIITAIEEGDEDLFPQEIFLKGFLRTYATFLRLDPSEIIRIYNQAKIAQEVSKDRPQPATTTPRRSLLGDRYSITSKSIAVFVIVLLISAVIGVNNLIKKYEKEGEIAHLPSDIKTIDPEAPSTQKTSRLLRTKKDFTEKTPVAAIKQKEKTLKKTDITTNKEVDAQKRLKEEAENRTKIAAEQFAKQEIEKRVKIEAEKLAKFKAEKKEKIEAERIAKLEAVKKIEAEKVAKLEAEKLATQQALKKKAEAEAIAKIEAQKKADLEVKRLKKLKAEALAKQESARLAKLEAEKSKKPKPPKEATTVVKKSAPLRQELIIEALDQVTIQFQIDKQGPKKIVLQPDQIHTIKAAKTVSLQVSDGGAVNVIFNGQDKGVPGELGQPKKIQFP